MDPITIGLSILAFLGGIEYQRKKTESAAKAADKKASSSKSATADTNKNKSIGTMPANSGKASAGPAALQATGGNVVVAADASAAPVVAGLATTPTNQTGGNLATPGTLASSAAPPPKKEEPKIEVVVPKIKTANVPKSANRPMLPAGAREGFSV